MKNCIGIISWLPNEPKDRRQRLGRVNRLLNQIADFWPDIDILLITQNWKAQAIPKTANNIARVDFKEGLGILKARKTLREEFLKRDYDYLIMFDDDAIIEETEKDGAKKYIDELEKHKDGFTFLQYKEAQLNGCAISKHIYKSEPMVNVDPQKDEGYEDTIFSNLLHYKYSKNEFTAVGIKCTQFRNSKEPVKSTWANGNHKYAIIWRNTAKIIDHIKKHGEFPDNWRSFCDLPDDAKNKKKTFLGYGNKYYGL